MEKNLILYLILFIYLFNYKFESFTETAKITIGSCWANSTNTSFDNINDNSPKWLNNVQKLRDKIITADSCNRFKKKWSEKLLKQQEETRSTFGNYFNIYICSERDNVLDKLQLKDDKNSEEKQRTEFYNGKKIRKTNRIKKIKDAIDLIKDIKFISKSNNKIAIELGKVLKSGVFKNNNSIKENCKILPGQDVNDSTNLIQ